MRLALFLVFFMRALLSQEADLATLRPGGRVIAELPADAETVETRALIDATGDAVPALPVVFSVEAEGDWVLELVAHTFDAYLVLRGDGEDVLAESGGGTLFTHARLELALTPGDYRLEVCAFDGASGPFELTAREGPVEDDVDRDALELADARAAVAVLHELRSGSKREAQAIERLLPMLISRGLEDEARPILEQLLAIQEADGDSLDAARTARLLAEISELLGFSADARSNAQRALALFEIELGADSPETAETRSLLGLIELAAGRNEEAAGHLGRAFSSLRKEAGPAAPATLRTLADFSAALASLGRFTEVRRNDELLLPAVRSALGPTAPETRDLLARLGDISHRLGDLPAARKYQEELVASTLDVSEGTADPARGARALQDLAWILREQGHDPAAAERFERALEILDEIGDPNAPTNLACAFDLARTHVAAGRDPAAAPFLDRALEGFERGLGPRSPRVADVRRTLAGVEERGGRLDLAGELYERAAVDLAVALGEEHPRAVHAALADAAFLGRHRDPQYAADRMAALLPRLERAVGKDHPLLGESRVALGRLRTRAGDARGALDELRAGRESLLSALGPKHADSIRATTALARALIQSGLEDEARALLLADLHSRPPTRFEAFEHATTRDRFEALGAERVELELLLTTWWKADPTEVDVEAYEAFTLWRAHRFAGRLTGGRYVASRAGGAASSLRELGRAQTQLARIGTAVDPAERRAPSMDRADRIHERARELSADLTRRLGAPNSRLPFEQLAWNLPPESALVDFAVLRPGNPGDDQAGTPELFAWITRDEPASLQAVRLGPAAPIEVLVTELGRALAQGRAEEIAVASAAVRERVWQPVEERLGDERRVLVVLDPLLVGLPFEVLPSAAPEAEEGEDAPAERLLIEERSFAYVVDLSRLTQARPVTPPDETRLLLLAGGVDPNAAVRAARSPRGEAVEAAGPVLRPGSAESVGIALREVRRLGAQHAELATRNTKTHELFGREATRERLLAALPRAHDLHLALPLLAAGPDAASLFDPVRGAPPLGAWPPGRLTGVGTADHLLDAGTLARLDLSRAERCVLTETAGPPGDHIAAAGLLDLVQALQSAGVGTVVATRLPLDGAQEALLEAFYTELWGGRPAGPALRRAQLAALRNARESDGNPHPERWAGLFLVPAKR